MPLHKDLTGADLHEPKPHAASHENGGSDEIDVTGLTGLLATAQTPASHNHAAADITSGTVATARLGSGTADGTTFLRGDQTWAAAGGGDALTSDGLDQFAATTSAELAGVISDETGTGALVFAGSPALTGTPTAPTAAGGTNTTQIATTAFVTAAVAAGGSYTDEMAQDAVGAMVDDGTVGDIVFTYTDATPKLSGAIQSDVALGGNPTTTTQTAGNNTTRIATTAFVQTELAARHASITEGATMTADMQNKYAGAFYLDDVLGVNATIEITNCPNGGSGVVMGQQDGTGRTLTATGAGVTHTMVGGDGTDAIPIPTEGGALWVASFVKINGEFIWTAGQRS